MCVCVHTCMCVHACVCTCVCVHACVCTHVYTCASQKSLESAWKYKHNFSFPELTRNNTISTTEETQDVGCSFLLVERTDITEIFHFINLGRGHA